MYNKQSWTTFGGCVLIVGLTLIGLAMMFICCGMREQDIVPVIIMMLLGVAISAAGINVLVWHLKDKYKYTGGKVDKSLEYVFTMSTPDETEVVSEYGQIERALKQLGQTKNGVVKISMEPPMANICEIDCSYKNGYFYTYFLQERIDGKGYWLSICDTTHVAMRNLRLLFVKHKKIEFDGMNRLETGKGR